MKTSYITARLWRFVKPYRKRYIAALTSTAIASALTPSLIAFIKPLTNGILTKNTKIMIPLTGISIPRDKMFLYLAAIITAITVLRGIFTYMSKYYAAYIGQNITKDIRNRVFRHMMYLSLSYHSAQQTGQLLSRITNDIKFLQTSIVKIPARLIRDGLQIVFIIFLLFYFNWKWAMLCLAGFYIIIFPFRHFSRALRRIGLEGHQKMADIYDFLTEKISGIRLIKAFSMEDDEQSAMQAVNKNFIDLVLQSERIHAFQGPLIEFLSAAGTVAVIVLVGKSVLLGTITPGDFFVFIGLVVGLYKPAKNFASLNQQLQRALAASERVFQVLDHKEHILQAKKPVEFHRVNTSIEFNNVWFAYENEEFVLQNIGIKAKRGERTAFVGPSGAGKTTLVNLIPRFFDPTRGRITIDGTDLRDYIVRTLRSQIAIVMQEVILFNMSILDNICYGNSNCPMEKVIEYAKAAHAHSFIEDLPDGYHTVIGERGVKLSGGQKQRIAIARALIQDPEILILDEATSHLDTESEKLVQDAMEKLIKGRTSLIIAHRLSTVKKADIIYVLENGKIAEQGKHEELMGFPGLYRKLFKMQSA